MSMGLVNDEDFQKEIARVVNIPRGRGHNPNTPESLRKLIGETVIEDGRAGTKEMARTFGVCDSSLSAYANGATSCRTYNQPNKELNNHVNKAREKIATKARNRLVYSLNSITKDKLKDQTPRDLAAIAKDMSSIVRDFEPRSDENITARALIIYAPQMVNESKFEVIDMEREA